MNVEVTSIFGIPWFDIHYSITPRLRFSVCIRGCAGRLSPQLILAFLSGDARAAANAGRAHFEVDGASVILRLNEASAQKRAIDDGLRNAVLRAVTQSMGEVAMLRHRQRIEKSILNASPRYVQKYRVLKRSVDRSAKVMKVRLEVLVDLSAVEETIRSLKLGRASRKQARLLFLVEEHILRTGGGKSPLTQTPSRLSVSEHRILYDFSRAGYTPIIPRGQRDTARPGQIRAAISGDLNSVRALGSLYGCPFVITMRTVVERERGGAIVVAAVAQAPVVQPRRNTPSGLRAMGPVYRAKRLLD